jgi:deoxycytidine triphosphate deaminase
MFINPTVAIEKGWIRGDITDKQVQPNAIDFTLDSLMQLSHLEPNYLHQKNEFPFVGESEKRMTPLQSCLTMNRGDGTKYWTLYKGTVYDGTSNLYVEVPEGVAAIVYSRSTLTRNGLFLMTGLYDSGYKGQIGFTLYPQMNSIQLEIGVRVGQIAFVHSESHGVYAGGWNHDEGTHYSTVSRRGAVTKT